MLERVRLRHRVMGDRPTERQKDTIVAERQTSLKEKDFGTGR